MTTIDLNDAAKFFGTVVAKEMRAASLRALLSAAKRMATLIVARYIPQAQPAPPVDRGEYKAAWNSGKEPDGAFFENTSAHAPMIEYGVRAGMIKPGRAVISAVAAWAIRKGLADETNATRAAFAIVTSMKNQGMVARAIMEKANADLLDKVVNEELEREIGRTMRKL